jgi:TctA family transporter
MIGFCMGGAYGGSRTAILPNVPDAPATSATALDGDPLGPVILGVILSRLLDDTGWRAIISDPENPPLPMKGILPSLLSLVLLVVIVLTIVSRTPPWGPIFRTRSA